MAGQDSTAVPPPPRETDILRWPWVGRWLRFRHVRLVLQVPLLIAAAALVVHGFWGPQVAPQNLATVLTWIHYRGILVVLLLGAGNLFCMACPFMLPRELARRLFKPPLRWPSWLRSKWLALGLFAAVLFCYEAFHLWSSPQWTAALIVGYFAGALAVDAIFQRASFCKWVCPIGQFNFLVSTLSPLEVRVAEPTVCATCRTKDCLAGTRDPLDRSVVVQRGCELELFLPRKTGNLDCTFCLDCVRACPHDNVAIATRLPASELWSDARRTGIGFFSRRPDLAALGVVFTFGALMNAFGMVSPVYAAEEWIGARLGTRQPMGPLAILFLLLLVVEPLLLLGAASWLTRGLARLRQPLLGVATRFAYALVPLGCGIWIAHYTFHLVTGLFTFIPVAQSALADAGMPLLGAPAWRLTGLPPALVAPLQDGFLSLGLVGSLLVAWQIAGREAPERTVLAFVPWAALAVLLAWSALWLLGQPMEMRGTFLLGA